MEFDLLSRYFNAYTQVPELFSGEMHRRIGGSGHSTIDTEEIDTKSRVVQVRMNIIALPTKHKLSR